MSAKVSSSTVDLALDKMRQKVAEKENENNPSLEAQMRTMYSIVKSGQPISQFNTMCQLQTLNNTPGTYLQNMNAQNKTISGSICAIEF